MRYFARIGRVTLKRFRAIALTTFLIAIAVASQLHISPSVQAQTAEVNQAGVNQAQITQVQLIEIAQAQLAKPSNPANVVLDWNVTALTVAASPPISPPQQYRSLAIVHTAIFDAVNAIDRRYASYGPKVKAPAGASAEAAAAAAGHGVLSRLYPAQQATLDAALTASLAKVADGQAKADGIAVGKEAAEKLVALRSNDGANKKVEYTAEKRPGIWQPTPPTLAPDLLPGWSQVTPFAIKSAEQFKVPDPYPLNSASYAKDLNEVKLLGARNSTVRTSEQTIAAVWSPIPPAVIWNSAARSAATAKGNSLIENARLFALLNIGGVDAYIAGYEVKYKHKLWRPVTAIRNAEALGNSAVTADPNWESLIVTPAHPDYISGHCVSAGAEERILQGFFGSDAVKVNIIFPANTGVTRSFTSFSQISKELGEARIWGGVHTRHADEQGDVLGKQVGEYVVKNALQPLKS